jgi:hypothetical protein
MQGAIPSSEHCQCQADANAWIAVLTTLHSSLLAGMTAFASSRNSYHRGRQESRLLPLLKEANDCVISVIIWQTSDISIVSAELKSAVFLPRFIAV